MNTELASPEPTVLVLDRNGTFLTEVKGSSGDESGYWPLDQIPDRVTEAVLAIEDHRFSHHWGIDPLALLRAAWQNFSHGKRISGASTIAMQVVRLQKPQARTYWNKTCEMILAAGMTLRHGRTKILKQYFKIAPFGNGVRGIRYAARKYFNKPLEDLSWSEISFLSAIPQAPQRMNPYAFHGRERAIVRGLKILDLLHSEGIIPGCEFDLAVAQLKIIQIVPRNSRPEEALHAILRMKKEIHKLRDNQDTVPLIMRSTIDLKVQQKITEQIRNIVWDLRPRGVGNAAVIVASSNTGEILSWVGSTDYFDKRYAGSIDYTGIKRSPGSTLKPFVYAYALDKGFIFPNTILPDIHRGAGGITNSDEKFLGPMLPRFALANSRNVPAANLLARIGLQSGYQFFMELGLHTGELSANKYGLGLAIGGLPVTLEELCRAYLVFNNNGSTQELKWFRNHEQKYQRRIMKTESTRLISLFLSDPQARLPTFPRSGYLEFPFPVAVKTGTSSNYRDAWTIAYSRKYITAIWLGDPDCHSMNRITGYNSAARLTKKIMEFLHPAWLQGLDDLSFPPPDDYQLVEICPFSGDLANQGTPFKIAEWLNHDCTPVRYSQAMITRAVDVRSGQVAESNTPFEFIKLVKFFNLPSEYIGWAKNRMLSAVQHSDLTTPKKIRIRITSPENNITIARDPEAPEFCSTLGLEAVVDPPQGEVVWYVDGKPFQSITFPYSVRWHLQPGEHTFQAKMPSVKASSDLIRVTVI